MKLRPSFVLLFVLLALAGGVGYRLFAPVAVETIHPTRGTAVQAVYATGTVEATVMLPIAPRASARLMELLVDEGSNVTKAQVLAQLEDEDLRHSLSELQAREQWANSEYRRRAALYKKGVYAKEALDEARSNWQAAQAAVSRAAAEVGYMKLLAPADGRIIRRDGEIGQLIPANQPVFWISCCAPLRITAEVDEEDVSQVQPGQPVLIRADAFPEKIFRGVVKSITPKGDPIARSYRVRIAFSEETPLLIGMTAETNILIHETKDALLIPATAVQNDKVWVVREGRLAEQKVTIGTRGETNVEIREGLTLEDRIVTTPPAGAKMGMRVR